MGKTARWLVPVVIVAALALAAWMALTPTPIEVDAGVVASGPMRLTVDEEGVTRIRERYVVSSPLGGRLRRIGLDPGDAVVEDVTTLAVIDPTDPELLDARAEAEAQARVRAAGAAVDQAAANIERAQAAVDLAQDEYARLSNAREQGASTPQELDEARFRLRMVTEELNAARHAREIAHYEEELARSALLFTSGAQGSETPLRMLSPISGEVLRVFQESVAVVTPGTALLEVGDRTDLEIVVDVLSTDGVRITPGDRMIVDHWGGDAPLEARVRLVEPSGFTKVSALGIEEQRVNVVADFTSPPADRATLGDAFRIEASVIVWATDATLRVPTSAVFRHGEGWAVFVIEGGRASLRPFGAGRQNGSATQVLDGLREGDRVVVHPSDQLRDGARVRVRG